MLMIVSAATAVSVIMMMVLVPVLMLMIVSAATAVSMIMMMLVSMVVLMLMVMPATAAVSVIMMILMFMLVAMLVLVIMTAPTAVSVVMVMADSAASSLTQFLGCAPGTSACSLYHYHIRLHGCDRLLDFRQHRLRILCRKTKLFCSIGDRDVG